MRAIRLWALIVGLLVLAAADFHPGAALAADANRVALVIGNSKYVNAVPLSNPANDARLIASTLRDAGFDVIEGVDQDNAGMHSLITRFTEKSYNADLAVIFYAGHGMQVDGKNYLIPVDAELTSPVYLKTRTVQIDEFMAALPPDPAVGVIILDACRDNPLARTLAASLPKSRSLGAGLAPVEARSDGVGTGGVLIAYATDPGAVAFDGDGVDSPYSLALAKHLTEPGVEIQSALTRVRGEVTEATQGRQRPWHNASLGREVFLGRAPLPSVTVAPNDARAWEIEQQLWEEASKRNTIAHYETYLRQFPKGVFADVARLNIDQLKQPKSAIVADTQPTTSSAPAVASDVGTEISESALVFSKSDRLNLQLRLKALGYDLGVLDGNFGPKTRRAIADWQRTEGITPTTFFSLKQRDLLVSETEALIRAGRANVAPKTPVAPRVAARPAKSNKSADAQVRKTVPNTKLPASGRGVAVTEVPMKNCTTARGEAPANPAPGFRPIACRPRLLHQYP
ncbi:MULTISPECIES: caspase family protein [unclassified Mesorhizobium]|uniref:caspase family protein n=1 Tax=unclassified Mesorhizobium TaxID=325217 RepID=UPI001FE1F364|nr:MULTISPECIES: caspase family protein [unclassified Mesorhizobium]